MDFVAIYEDNEQKVYMPKKIADELNFIANSQKQLSKMEFEQFTQEALEYLDNFFQIKGKEHGVISTSKAIILSRGKYCHVTEIYQALTDAILLVSEAFDNTEGQVTLQWKMDLEIMVRLYYQLESSQKCIAHFYETTLNGISGFIAIELEDSILILPIVLNEEGKSLSIY